MRLYLVRHAIAVPHGTPGFARDADRPLTDEGRSQAADAARGLKRLKVPLEAIATSPYLRAVQTAEQLAGVFDARLPLRELGALKAEADPRDASLALKGFSACGHVALVGHEPHLSRWLGLLVTARGDLRCLFKKGGVACVEVERVPPPDGSGTLRWLLTAKQLALIGGAS
jgi:phosphohistidine phosphatase